MVITEDTVKSEPYTITDNYKVERIYDSVALLTVIHPDGTKESIKAIRHAE